MLSFPVTFLKVSVIFWPFEQLLGRDLLLLTILVVLAVFAVVLAAVRRLLPALLLLLPFVFVLLLFLLLWRNKSWWSQTGRIKHLKKKTWFFFWSFTFFSFLCLCCFLFLCFLSLLFLLGVSSLVEVAPPVDDNGTTRCCV